MLLLWERKACHLRDRPARDADVCHPHPEHGVLLVQRSNSRSGTFDQMHVFFRKSVPYLQKEHTCMLSWRNCMNLLFRSMVKGFSMKYTPSKVPFFFSPNASATMSRHALTTLSAAGRLRIPVVFAGEYSVQGGEAHTIVNHPIG